MPNAAKKSAMKQLFKVVKNAAKKAAEMYIYDDIGESWFGGLTASQFKDELKDLGDVETITLHINSYGGNVFDGMAIYNLLVNHKAHVEVLVDGIAASIASVIAMAGNTIKMAENGMLMIHEAWGVAVGNAGEMRKTADSLEKINETIRLTYARRTGQADADLVDMMAVETWMTAQEAKEKGFIDEVQPALAMAAHYDASKFKFKNVPENILHPKKADDANRQRLAKMNIRASRIRGASARCSK